MLAAHPRDTETTPDTPKVTYAEKARANLCINVVASRFVRYVCICMLIVSAVLLLLIIAYSFISGIPKLKNGPLLTASLLLASVTFCVLAIFTIKLALIVREREHHSKDISALLELDENKEKLKRAAPTTNINLKLTAQHNYFIITLLICSSLAIIATITTFALHGSYSQISGNQGVSPALLVLRITATVIGIIGIIACIGVFIKKKTYPRDNTGCIIRLLGFIDVARNCSLELVESNSPNMEHFSKRLEKLKIKYTSETDTGIQLNSDLAKKLKKHRKDDALIMKASKKLSALDEPRKDVCSSLSNGVLISLFNYALEPVKEALHKEPNIEQPNSPPPQYSPPPPYDTNDIQEHSSSNVQKPIPEDIQGHNPNNIQKPSTTLESTNCLRANNEPSRNRSLSANSLPRLCPQFKYASYGKTCVPDK